MVSQVVRTEEESLFLTCCLLSCVESPIYHGPSFLQGHTADVGTAVGYQDPQALLGRAAFQPAGAWSVLLNETIPSQIQDVYLSWTLEGSYQPFLQPAKVLPHSSPDFQHVNHFSQSGIIHKHRVHSMPSLVVNKAVAQYWPWYWPLRDAISKLAVNLTLYCWSQSL